MNKYFIKTFGCQMNVADSNLMAAHLEDRGMALTDSRENADVIILNTCSVRFHAEHKALSFIGRLKPLKLENPNLKIIVAGCAAQRMGKELKKRFPIVDLVIGAKEMDYVGEIIERSFPNKLSDVTARSVHTALPSRQKESAAMAFVTIIRGCQNFCSYCIVPHVRGPEKSRPVQEIISEIESRAADGYKDIMLLGQNVNSYNGKCESGEQIDFPGMLELINDIKGIERIRFMTSHPKDLSDRLINAIAELDKVCEHLHLPLQSGSDTILSAMNRKYTVADYCALVDKVRSRLPDISLTTDILIGFPGETEDDLNKTRDLINRIEFNALFAFKYSPREGTASFTIAETISEAEKEKRLQIILEAADAISIKKNTALFGTIQNVLVEKTEDGICTGRTRSNLKVFFPAPPDKNINGTFIDVEITKAKINTLTGIIRDASHTI